MQLNVERISSISIKYIIFVKHNFDAGHKHSSYLIGVCFYLETVAADGLITGTRIKPMMETGSCGHQQAAHFGAVTLKHSHAFMTLQKSGNKMQDCSVAAFTEIVNL